MPVVPVIRAISAILKTRHPGLAVRYGNNQETVPGNGSVTWLFGRGEWEGGVQTDQKAKVIAHRKVGMECEIRWKASSQGVSDKDIEAAEEVVRSVGIALDAYMSGDYGTGDDETVEEDWSDTRHGPAGAGVVCRLSFKLCVKLEDDPWVRVALQHIQATGQLDLTGVML